MKKRLLTALAAVLALALLAACGTAPAQTSSGTPAPGPGSTPESTGTSSVLAQDPASGSSSVPDSGTAPGPDAIDLDALAVTLAEAAGLGETIPYPDDIDLRAGGMNLDNIAAYAGLTAKTSSQNGGIVVVVQAAAGTASSVAADFEAYRDASLGNTDYTEFETARTNTQNARIEVFGDVVVYAVSATGHEGGWDALDAAIAAAFA